MLNGENTDEHEYHDTAMDELALVNDMAEGNDFPGIAGGSLRTETRSTPGTVVLSDSQIQKIANAVRDGASRATINLDGDKVSSRLQTPTVLNTLPGV